MIFSSSSSAPPPINRPTTDYFRSRGRLPPGATLNLVTSEYDDVTLSDVTSSHTRGTHTTTDGLGCLYNALLGKQPRRYETCDCFCYERKSCHQAAPSLHSPKVSPGGDDGREVGAVEVRGMNKREVEETRRHHTSELEAGGDEGREVGAGEVKGVDMCEVEDTRHHTSEFEAKGKLVVRRGEPVKMKVTFQGSVRSEDLVGCKMVFKIGRKNRASNGTAVFLPMVHDGRSRGNRSTGDSRSWSIEECVISGRDVSVQVTPSACCPVGLWQVSVLYGDKGQHEYVVPERVYILFNPWCKDDIVYMMREEERTEYVLNDVGKIWRGTCKNLRPITWSYAQFEDPVLDCCLFLLNQANLPYAARGDPVKVMRAISAAVNAPYDSGVLVGNWSGVYKGGRSPTSWSGSLAILRQYYQTRKAVKFGQCWVFAGVATTISRCLGLPCRTVTNFSSAHDTNSSVTIDKYYSEDLDFLDDETTDSVWNFHVWNEAWCNRLDLPPGYGGWQVFDSTPQELSEGEFRCGPAPLRAIKEGEIGYMYDSPFIFAEVNADMVSWICHKNGEMEKFNVDQKQIGRMISTKAPGSLKYGNDDRMDITDLYKHPEKSDEERISVLNAMFRSGSGVRSAYLGHSEHNDIAFQFSDLVTVMVGEDFTVRLHLENKSRQDSRTVRVILSCWSMFYTGVLADRCREETYTVYLKPGERHDCKMVVDVASYLDQRVDQSNFECSARAKVLETNQVMCEQDAFRVLMPDIDIQSRGTARVNSPISIVCRMKNPLRKNLHHCQFTVEGPGLESPRLIEISDVRSGEVASCEVEVTPAKRGDRTILVAFNAKELDDVHSSANISVHA